MSKETKPIEYFSLSAAADENVDKNNVYEKILEYALKNENIRNIALTGIYGAGKSSILIKFKNKHCADKKKKQNDTENDNYDFYNISLATFKDSERNKILNTQMIEECILQQFFYEIAPEKIPNSRFKRIKPNINVSERIIYECLTLSFFFTGSIVFFHKSMESYDSLIKSIQDSNIPFLKCIPHIILTVFILVSLFFFHIGFKKLYEKIFKYQVNLKYQNLEVEVTPNDIKNNCSIFNKYMDEIIYFFEVTKYNVIIIEDLDRFKNPDIFIKFRELNIILNNSETIGRKITFIYALKDDVIINDRTKFFDLIIPVIPYMSVSNSTLLLKDMLMKLELEDFANSIPVQYYSDIVLFINDVRIMKNVVNEFKIYNNLLINNKSNDKRQDRKLLSRFSLIVYKNICPLDFARLEINKGIVSYFLKNKTELINYQLEKNNNIIRQYSKSLETEFSNVNIKKEINNIKDEISKYLFEDILNIAINDNNIGSISISNGATKDYDIDGFLDLDYTNIDDSKSIEITYRLNDSSQLLNKVLIPHHVKKVKELFEKKYNKEIYFKSEKDNLKREINELKNNANNELDSLKNKPLTDILTSKRFNIDLQEFVEKKSEISLKDHTDEQLNFIKLMLKKGYIDENCYDYISYFYEGQLYNKDRMTLINIKSGNLNSCYDSEIINIDEVMKQLNIKDFSTAAFYNHSILNYFIDCLQNHFLDDNTKNCMKSAINTICEDDNTGIEFVESFLEFLRKNEQTDVFPTKFRILCKIVINNSESGFDFLNRLLKKKSEYEKLYKEFISVIINDVPLLSLQKQKQKFEIRDALSSCAFLFDISIDQNNIEQLIKIFDIKFNNISFKEEAKDNTLLRSIFENGYFTINEKMMNCINELYFGSIDFNIKNYTIICESSLDWLKKQVNENFVEYVDYLKTINNSFMDDQKYIVNLLKSNKLNADSKIIILRKENTTIDDINNINESLWELALNENKIKISWDNIYKFYDKNSLTDELNNFLMGNLNYLVNNLDDNNDKLIDILNIRKEKLEHYNNLINFTSISLDENIVKNISLKLMERFIDNKLVALTINNINFIFSRYKTLFLQYINSDLKQFNKVLDFSNPLNFVYEEIVYMSIFLDYHKLIFLLIDKLEQLADLQIITILKFNKDFCYLFNSNHDQKYKYDSKTRNFFEKISHKKFVENVKFINESDVIVKIKIDYCHNLILNSKINKDFEYFNFKDLILNIRDFSFLSLIGANFENSDLSYCNLSNSILTSANFTNSNLSYCNLSNTELNRTDFENTEFLQTKMDCIDIDSLNLTFQQKEGIISNGTELNNEHYIKLDNEKNYGPIENENKKDLDIDNEGEIHIFNMKDLDFENGEDLDVDNDILTKNQIEQKEGIISNVTGSNDEHYIKLDNEENYGPIENENEKNLDIDNEGEIHIFNMKDLDFENGEDLDVDNDILTKNQIEQKEEISENSSNIKQIKPVFKLDDDYERMLNRNFVRQDLRNSDFVRKNLSGCDFEDANLENADFTKSILRNVNFRGANLKNTKFADSDLRGSDFSYSDLSYADLQNSNLSYVNFSHACLYWANLFGTNLFGAIFNKTDKRKTIIEDDDFY